MRAAVQLTRNLEVLTVSNNHVVNDDAVSLLRKGNQGAPYHIVFVDPPFQLNLWQIVIDALETGSWLAEDASIYIESGRDQSYQPPANWVLHRDKHAGAVSYRLFYREQKDC